MILTNQVAINIYIKSALAVTTATHCRAITRAVKLRTGTHGNMVVMSLYQMGNWACRWVIQGKAQYESRHTKREMRDNPDERALLYYCSRTVQFSALPPPVALAWSYPMWNGAHS